MMHHHHIPQSVPPHGLVHPERQGKNCHASSPWVAGNSYHKKAEWSLQVSSRIPYYRAVESSYFTHQHTITFRLRLLSVNCVRTTNNLPSIVVVEKVAVDQVRGAVKRQLGYLAQFVSVSPEMYKAVHYEKIDETTF